MFARILVATDLTSTTRNSLSAAFNLAQRNQSEILLVHVIRRITGIPDREMRDFYDRLKANARLKMYGLTKWFTEQHGVEIACEVTIGQPAPEIVRVARDAGTDLIVLAHAPAESPLGSVSYKVALLAPCHVLMLRQPQTETAARTRSVKRPSSTRVRTTSRRRVRA